MVKVFLDIDIGDRVEHDKLTAEYTLSQEFCTRKGAQARAASTAEKRNTHVYILLT